MSCLIQCLLNWVMKLFVSAPVADRIKELAVGGEVLAFVW